MIAILFVVFLIAAASLPDDPERESDLRPFYMTNRRYFWLLVALFQLCYVWFGIYFIGGLFERFGPLLTAQFALQMTVLFAVPIGLAGTASRPAPPTTWVSSSFSPSMPGTTRPTRSSEVGDVQPLTPSTCRFAAAALLAVVFASGAIANSFVGTAHAETAPAPGERPGFDLARPEIAAFIARLVSRDNFTKDEVTQVLGAGHARPELVPAMTRPAEKILAWWEYRDRYVTASRIAGGVEFWQQHAALLDEIAATHGVPAEYLIAILGIETNYGRITGTYPEIDTLMTLAFDYPARDAYFRTELRQYLLLARGLGRDPLSLKGSYGGALGVPQLMPSSYRRFAASAPEWQKVDLWTDWSAILSSIAGFLEQRGWERGGPVLLPARIRGDREATVTGGLTPNETIAALKRRGVRIDAKVPATTEAVLIRAVLKEGAEYRVGFKNFRVISRYNPRTNYTMAVCDLAATLKERRSEPALSAPKAAGSGG